MHVRQPVSFDGVGNQAGVVGIRLDGVDPTVDADAARSQRRVPTDIGADVDETRTRGEKPAQYICSTCGSQNPSVMIGPDTELIGPVERNLDAVDSDIGDIVLREPYRERRRRALLIDAPEKASNRGRAQLHRMQRITNCGIGL